MTDRPMIFSASMVRALIEGRKTQTRRIQNGRSGFGKTDRLYVRETFCHFPDNCRDGMGEQTYFRADQRPDRVEEDDAVMKRNGVKWRPAIHMPRTFSRLTLKVTDVRVERLNDISEADAMAEGVEYETADPPFYYVPGIHPHSITGVGVEERNPRPAAASFAKLWGYINGAETWGENPWVAAVSFEVIKANIDHVDA